MGADPRKARLAAGARAGCLAWTFFLFVFSGSAQANECTPTTLVKALFLGQTADVLDPGRIELGVQNGRGLDAADYDLFRMQAELGIGARWQFQADWDERRLPDGGIDHAVTLGGGYELYCAPGAPTLRLDAGFHHNGGNGVIAGLTAGQDLEFASWQAGVARNAAVYSTRYTGALLLDKLFFPVVIEALFDDNVRGWERWYGAGFYLLSNRHLDIGLAYAVGSGISEDEKRAMVRVSFTF